MRADRVLVHETRFSLYSVVEIFSLQVQQLPQYSKRLESYDNLIGII
jgi:hypothetical protein